MVVTLRTYDYALQRLRFATALFATALGDCAWRLRLATALGDYAWRLRLATTLRNNYPLMTVRSAAKHQQLRFTTALL